VKRSAARIAAEPEFSYINEDLDRTKQRLAENRISLNEKARIAELDDDKARQEKRAAERAKITVPEQKDYIVTLENLNKPELELAKAEAKDENGDSAKAEPDELDPTDPDGEDAEGNPKKPAIDPVRNEALNIIADLVDLSKSPKPSTTTAAK
jgi:carboxyl-terminal processing protease